MQPIIELKSELEGIIKLEIIKPDGTLKEAEGLNTPFYNLITDAGLNFVIGGSNVSLATQYCKVGTSSTPPTVNDTTLGAQTGSVSPRVVAISRTIQYTTEPYYSNHKRVYTFAVGSVSGNLTEIGFFSAATGGTMWSRALIKDSGGNPTTLAILATEQLKVTYTVRRYIPSLLTGSFTLNTNGTCSTINYTITPANIATFSSPWYNEDCHCSTVYTGVYPYETNVLGAITSTPGDVTTIAGETREVYIQGSFQELFYIKIPASGANFATGIGSISFWTIVNDGGRGYDPYTGYDAFTGYQCSFSPKIMKTSSQMLTIGIKLSWGRTTQQ